jgi:hypothetical protein
VDHGIVGFELEASLRQPARCHRRAVGADQKDAAAVAGHPLRGPGEALAQVSSALRRDQVRARGKQASPHLRLRLRIDAKLSLGDVHGRGFTPGVGQHPRGKSGGALLAKSGDEPRLHPPRHRCLGEDDDPRPLHPLRQE